MKNKTGLVILATSGLIATASLFADRALPPVVIEPTPIYVGVPEVTATATPVVEPVVAPVGVGGPSEDELMARCAELVRFNMMFDPEYSQCDTIE